MATEETYADGGAGFDPVALATRAADAVAALADVDWGQASGAGVLVRALAEVTRAQAALDSTRLTIAQHIDACDGAAEFGWASTKDFLTALAGGHKGTGGGVLRLAERLRALPRVREALAAGAVSADQARVIANRVVTLPRDVVFRENVADAMLAKVAAEHLDATDLDRAFPGILKELDPDGRLLGDERSLERRERGAHAARFLSFTTDAVGGVKLKGYGTPEDAERIKTALIPLAAPVSTEPGSCGGKPGPRRVRDNEGRRLESGCPDPMCAHDGRDPREHGARMWDALVEVCDRMIGSDELPLDHGGAPRIIVKLDYSALVKPSGSGVDLGGDLAGGDPLSVAAVRRLACDAELIPAVLGSQGQVLDVGRANRFVTAAIWYALVVRDQHCAFPGCTRLPVACDAHHIVHWVDGGVTALSNLVMLCRQHHTLVHRSPWSVRIDEITGRPVWTPPRWNDDRERFTRYVPPSHPPQQAA